MLTIFVIILVLGAYGWLLNRLISYFFVQYVADIIMLAYAGLSIVYICYQLAIRS